MKKLLLAILICVLPFLMGPVPRAGYRGPARVLLSDTTITNVIGVGAGSVGYGDLTIYSANAASFKELELVIESLMPAGPAGAVVGLYAQAVDSAGAVYNGALAYRTAWAGRCSGPFTNDLKTDNGWPIAADTATIAPTIALAAYGTLRVETVSLRAGMNSHFGWIENGVGDACVQASAGRYFLADVSVAGFKLYFANFADTYPITGATLDAASDPVRVNAAAHGLSAGAVVAIDDCTGETALNGKSFTVTNVFAGTFDLAEATGGGYGAGVACTVHHAIDATARLYGIPY